MAVYTYQCRAVLTYRAELTTSYSRRVVVMYCLEPVVLFCKSSAPPDRRPITIPSAFLTCFGRLLCSRVTSRFSDLRILRTYPSPILAINRRTNPSPQFLNPLLPPRLNPRLDLSTQHLNRASLKHRNTPINNNILKQHLRANPQAA